LKSWGGWWGGETRAGKKREKEECQKGRLWARLIKIVRKKPTFIGPSFHKAGEFAGVGGGRDKSLEADEDVKGAGLWEIERVDSKRRDAQAN